MSGKIDFFTKSDIKLNISRIEELINTGIFDSKNSKNSINPLFKSAFIEIIICLRDLMAKTKKFSSEINFTDDIFITQDVINVTVLIKFIRDALCHIDSDNHFIIPDDIKSSFNVRFGKGNFMKINNISISSDYDDDICFFFGNQKIYFNRHIIRAFEEAKTKLIPLL